VSSRETPNPGIGWASPGTDRMLELERGGSSCQRKVGGQIVRVCLPAPFLNQRAVAKKYFRL